MSSSQLNTKRIAAYLEFVREPGRPVDVIANLLQLRDALREGVEAESRGVQRVLQTHHRPVTLHLQG